MKRGQRDTGYWRGLAYFTGCPAIRPLCTAHCTLLHTRARATRKVENGGEGGTGEKRGDRSRGEGRGHRRRGRSESDRETERLFNGVELVIGVFCRGKGDGRGEGVRAEYAAGYAIYTRKCLDDAYLPAYPRNRYFPATASC